MKIRTSELTGLALCYTVTLLEMPNLVWGETIGVHHASHQIVVPHLPAPYCYSPFTTWPMFGSIFEREKIDLEWVAADKCRARYNWLDEEFFGPTALIATLRCYVASKLGDEVEIPEELV